MKKQYLSTNAPLSNRAVRSQFKRMSVSSEVLPLVNTEKDTPVPTFNQQDEIAVVPLDQVPELLKSLNRDVSNKQMKELLELLRPVTVNNGIKYDTFIEIASPILFGAEDDEMDLSHAEPDSIDRMVADLLQEGQLSIIQGLEETNLDLDMDAENAKFDSKQLQNELSLCQTNIKNMERAMEKMKQDKIKLAEELNAARKKEKASLAQSSLAGAAARNSSMQRRKIESARGQLTSLQSIIDRLSTSLGFGEPILNGILANDVANKPSSSNVSVEMHAILKKSYSFIAKIYETYGGSDVQVSEEAPTILKEMTSQMKVISQWPLVENNIEKEQKHDTSKRTTHHEGKPALDRLRSVSLGSGPIPVVTTKSSTRVMPVPGRHRSKTSEEFHSKEGKHRTMPKPKLAGQDTL